MAEITEDLKAALIRANETYQAGYDEGHRVGQIEGYRAGFAEATKRATELVDKTLGPLIEQRKEPS